MLSHAIIVRTSGETATGEQSTGESEMPTSVWPHMLPMCPSGWPSRINDWSTRWPTDQLGYTFKFNYSIVSLTHRHPCEWPRRESMEKTKRFNVAERHTNHPDPDAREHNKWLRICLCLVNLIASTIFPLFNSFSVPRNYNQGLKFP